MLKTFTRMLLLVVAAVATQASLVEAALTFTEVRSKAATDPEDYFELTNFGSAPVDITGWSFDDESADIADAAPLVGVSTIAPGESVVIFQLDENDPNDPAYDPAGEVALFRGFWGGLAGVQVGYHGGAGLGKGDAITLFDAANAIALTLEYGMTLPEQTHAGDWAAGNADGSDLFENQSAIYAPGAPVGFVTAGPGVLGSFANTDGDYGSPGVAIPEPASLVLVALGAGVATRRRR
ncbi:MAG: lamin tail domain-containing protein [Planctomycetota bacterium]